MPEEIEISDNNNESIDDSTCLRCDEKGLPHHKCPYFNELFGDDGLCNCCDNCTQECALDV